MTSRGLPGFLRRSLRAVEYDDEDEDSTSNAEEKEEETSESNSPREELTAIEEAARRSEGPEGKSDNDNGTPVANRQPDAAPLSEGNLHIHHEHNNNHSKNGRESSSSSTRSNSLPPVTTMNDLSERSHSSVFSRRSTTSNSHGDFSDSWQHRPSPEMPSLRHAVSEHGGSSSASAAAAGGLKQKSYRETQYEKALAADVVNLAALRKLAWNGIPPCYRAETWKLLLGYLPTNAARRAPNLVRRRLEYQDAIAQHYDIHDDVRTLQEQETLRQVLVDVPRTAPDVPLFRNDRIRRILTRLLYIWAIRHPASSYVQGINDLATPLVSVFLADYFEGQEYDVLHGHVMNHLSDEHLHQLEADVYWCLTNLLAGIQDHYTSDQPGVQRMVLRLEELVNRIDAALCRHFRDMGIEFLQFAFKWMNCLLLREFSLKCVFRLWDTYLSEKDGFEGFHVYVCAAFLCQFSSQLQQMTFDELFAFLQGMQTADWTDTEVEVLLSQAYVLSTLFGGSDAHLNNTAVTTTPR